MMMADRVISEARRWIGTPYCHRARLRGVGVDCAQLPLAVYAACGITGLPDPGDYPIQWHMHRSSERYLQGALAVADEVQDPAPGDLVIFQYGRTHSHGAIITEWPHIIHAAAGRGVVEDNADSNADMCSRPRKFFRIRESA